MRVFAIAIVVMLFSSITLSQAKAQPDIQKSGDGAAAEVQDRQTALQKFNQLKATAAALENVLLAPEKQDIEAAKKENVDVFRILPREIYDNSLFSTRGGGSYYSFTTGSHSYDKIPQIEYQRDRLSVGFYGLCYGLIADLGEVGLQGLGKENPEIARLLAYQPARFETDIRKEQYASQRNAPAIVGHTYALRAISYDEADTVVAFNVSKKDDDGSLIIFWKKIADFPKPVALYQPDQELQDKVRTILNENGFSNVGLSVQDNQIILSGSVPRGSTAKMFNLLQDVRSRGYQSSVREQ